MVIFEPHSTGHRREYIQHLWNFVLQDDRREQYSFVVNAEWRMQNAESGARNLTPDTRHLIPKEQSQYLLRGNILARSFKYHSLAKKHAKDLKAKHFLFLWLNDVQLALGLFGFPCAVSGILFKPFVRMERKGFYSRLVFVRKWVQTWLLAKQKRVERIWILNDEEAVEELNRRFRTEKFVVLPEPISIWESYPEFDVRAHFGIEKNREILIHFGTLSTRKGTPQVFESISKLSKEKQNELTLLVLGKPQSGMEEIIIESFAEAQMKAKGAQLVYKPEFVSNEVLQSIIEECNGILIPYKNIESSSGILGHAITNGKPVVAVGKGLLGDLVRKYNAGVLIEDNSADKIAGGILELLTRDFKEINVEEYVDMHSGREFASMLIHPHNPVLYKKEGKTSPLLASRKGPGVG